MSPNCLLLQHPRRCRIVFSTNTTPPPGKQEGDGPIYEHATMVTVLSLIMRSNTQMGQI